MTSKLWTPPDRTKRQSFKRRRKKKPANPAIIGNLRTEEIRRVDEWKATQLKDGIRIGRMGKITKLIDDGKGECC